MGRYVSVDKPKRGRYSKRQLRVLYRKVVDERQALMRNTDLTKYKSYGNRLMVFSGILSLGGYRALRSEGVTHRYATLLVADVTWKLYISGAQLFWLLAGLAAREPQKRLNVTLRMLCKFPFSPDQNGYQYEVRTMPDHLSMDFTQCVVHQFMKIAGSQEEMDFFRNSWCLYDFSLPGYLTEGGGYEREHTLSHGDNVCDMKWFAKPIQTDESEQSNR